MLWILRQLMYGSLFLITLILLTLYSLRFSFIQNRLLPRVELQVEAALGVNVEIGSVDIALWDYLILRNVKIYDTRNIEFISFKELKVSLINTSISGWAGAVGSQKYIKVRSIELTDPYFNLYRRTEDLKMNMFFLTESDDTTESASPDIRIKVGNLSVYNGRFNYIDSAKGAENLAKNQSMNFIHLMLDSIQTELSFDMGAGGQIHSNIKNLTARENWSGFILDTFQTQFHSGKEVQEFNLSRYDKDKKAFVPYRCYEEIPFVRLDKTLICAMGSRIDADINLPQEYLGELFDAELEEDWHVQFRHSTIDFALVNSFSTYKLPFHTPVYLKGTVLGKLNKLRSNDLYINLGDSTFVDASVKFEDLIEDGDIQMELKIRNSFLRMKDIQKFIPTVPIPEILKNAEEIRLAGSFTGFFNDFVIRMNAYTPQGNATADVHLDMKSPVMSWGGNITTQSFDVNSILGKSSAISSDLNLTADFKGKGDNFDNLSGYFNLSIMQSDLGGFQVDSVFTKLEYKNNLLSGPLDIRDVELGNIHTQNDIYLSNTLKRYEILGDLQNLNLQKLGVSKNPLRISTVMNINLEGDSLENLKGLARLFETHISNAEDDSIYIQDFVMRVRLDSSGGKDIRIRSDKLRLDLHTDVTLTRSVEVLSRLGHEAVLFFNNNDSLTQAYYQTLVKDSIPSGFKLDMKIEEMESVFAFFKLDMYISPGTHFKVDLSTGNTDIIHFQLEADSLKYNTYALRGNRIDGNIFKAAGSNEILAQSSVFIKSLHLGEDLVFENVDFEPVWSNEKIEFEIFARQEVYQNRIHLNGYTRFEEDKIDLVISSNNSTLLLNKDLWTFKGKNIITYYSRTGNIELNDVHLLDLNKQSIHIYGDISSEPGQSLVIKLDNVKVSTLNQLAGTGEDIEGILNAQFMISDILTDPYFQGFVFVKDFGFRKLQYGDVEANAVWNKTTKILSLDASLQKDGQKLFALTGHYATEDTISPLNFKLASYNLPLVLAEPFLDGHVYDLEGTVELNEFTAKGTLSKPVITGTGYFKDVSFMVDYTKTRYKFTGNIKFNERNINFLNIRLFDERSNSARQNYANLNGYIYHQGFRDFKFNIELESIRNFMVFNTKKEDNELFYGKLIVKDGVASIDGDLNTIKLTTFVETGAGTILNIPLTDYNEGYTLDYVTFISDEIETEIKEKLKLTGFELKITVNATPDATIRLIFDERTGEIIEARGTGNIDLETNAEGEFLMRGSYEIEKGEYLFTIQNGAINKKFFIEKGGNITWTGSPQDANINLKAYYQVYANISDLMGPNASGGFRVPVRVIMFMRGSLLSPEITLDIDIQNLSDLSTAEVTSRLKAITSDPQQLNQQVFSLLLFSKFSPQQNTITTTETANRSSGLSSSVSEVVSNQLNYWISQSLGNKFSANISSNQFQNLNVALEAKLFNDRITVERNGAITSSANNDLTIGNINVQLKLWPPVNPKNKRRRQNPNPGILAVEVFNREQFGFSGNNAITRGGGIFYRKDFDTIGELLKSYKARNAAPPPPDSIPAIEPEIINPR